MVLTKMGRSSRVIVGVLSIILLTFEKMLRSLVPGEYGGGQEGFGSRSRWYL